MAADVVEAVDGSGDRREGPGGALCGRVAGGIVLGSEDGLATDEIVSPEHDGPAEGVE